MTTDNKFTNFLRFTNSQKEVSLIIAKDDVELSQLQVQLDENGFKKIGNYIGLLMHIQYPSKNYFVIHKYMPKEIYDLILQYPTGQVEIFDQYKMKSETAKPLYKDISMVLITTKDILSTIQKAGYQLLENVGITYQS
jgi:hypothetical protein